MTFLDTGILVGALLAKHPEHTKCIAALEQFKDCFTDAHALAETFATLTGAYQVPTGIAAELTLSLRQKLTIEPLAMKDYETAISEARSRGVMGGGIYDSLHAHVRPAQRRRAHCNAQSLPFRAYSARYRSADALMLPLSSFISGSHWSARASSRASATKRKYGPRFG